MNNSPTSNSEQNIVGAGGVVRGFDERGHLTFYVKLPNRPVLHGEWVVTWPKNDRIAFAVDIISFGYRDEGNVTNPHPRAREGLTHHEAETVASLIKGFFENPSNTKGVFPFVDGSKLSAGINFAAGWVRINS